MQVGDKVALSVAGSGLNKNKLMVSGGEWEGTLTEIRGDEYLVYWVLVSGRTTLGVLTTGALHQHARSEIKYA